MRVLVQHLKYRLLAGLTLALIGNSSAASPAGTDRDVLKFKPASPNLRPQGNKTYKDTGTLRNNFVLTQPIAPVAPPPAPQAPVAPVTNIPFPQARPTTGNFAPTPPTSAPPVVSSPPVVPTQPTPPVVSSPPVAPPTTPPTDTSPPVSAPPTPQPVVSTPIAQPPNETEAGLTGTPGCPDGKCASGSHIAGLDNQIKDFKKVASAGQQNVKPANKSLLDRLTVETVKQAVKGRPVQPHCLKKGGARFRKGNVSKCACAAAVKDALFASGVCPSRSSDDAIQLAGYKYRGTTASLKNTGPTASRSLAGMCPALHQTYGKNDTLSGTLKAALNAPAGSVIVYSTSRHKWGHVEIKIQVTAENYAQLSQSLKVKVGSFLYCSDFCRTQPFLGHGTNRVVGIYSL